MPYLFNNNHYNLSYKQQEQIGPEVVNWHGN